MKKFIKVICLVLCMVSATALFAACTKPDGESQGSTDSGGGQINLSDYFEEEVTNAFATSNADEIKTITLTCLTDNIAWNTDNITKSVVFTIKKDFRLLGISFDMKGLEKREKSYNFLAYNNSETTIFNVISQDLKKQTFALEKDEIKSFSYDLKEYMSRGYLLEKGSTFTLSFSRYRIIDNIKFTINPV